MSDDNLRRTAYCGLYCDDCSFGQGTIPDLARDLRKELREARFAEIAGSIPFPEFKKYDDCYEVLGAMVKLRCKGCRGGSRRRGVPPLAHGRPGNRNPGRGRRREGDPARPGQVWGDDALGCGRPAIVTGAVPLPP